jgi:hypothetical protein
VINVAVADLAGSRIGPEGQHDGSACGGSSGQDAAEGDWILDAPSEVERPVPSGAIFWKPGSARSLTLRRLPLGSSKLGQRQAQQQIALAAAE